MGTTGRPRRTPPRYRAPLALVLASVLWGTTGTAASLLPANVSPLAVGSATMGVGGALLFGSAIGPSVAALRDGAARRWLLIGAIGVVVYPLAFYAAMDLAGVAIGNVVALGSGPVFAAFFEWAWERRRPGRAWIICTLIAILGIGLLALGGSFRNGRPAPGLIPGVALGLVAGTAYALYTYGSSRAIALGQPSRGVMGGMFGLGAIVLLPVLLATGQPLLLTPASVAISAYLAIGPMLVAYLLFGVALGSLRSSTTTTITLIEPLVATVLAVVVVGERLAAVGWVGLALILAGVTAMTAARHPDERP
ncbi:MAG: EamA family transporter [Actinomycetota bacterium]